MLKKRIKAIIKKYTKKKEIMSTLTEKNLIGIIANSSSPKNRELLVRGLGPPKNGIFNPLKFTYGHLKGEIIPLDVQPNEILHSAGFFQAKQAAFRAVDYLVEQGAKIICFTASTKRLPGKEGKEIKNLYPEHIFSLGDNATIISFKFILEHFLAALDKEEDEIACVGAGFIGNEAINSFLNNGFKKINVVSKYLNNLPPIVKIVNLVEQLPKNLKLMASCSHKYKPDLNSFKDLFAKKATIIDVSVPPMVNLKLYKSLPQEVERLDAGDFYLDGIDYDFDPKILGFPEKAYWYGCFTEAVILALAHSDGHDLSHYNFFAINQNNQELINGYLKRERLCIPFINFFEPKKEIRKICL